jgi:LacI family transcriptional regulator
MITIKHIARKAGVTIGTVDRVLHGRGRVAKKTASRVMRIVTSTGYRTNVFARNLVRSRTWKFAVLMPRRTQDSGYWGLAAQGVNRAQSELSAYHVETPVFEFNRFSSRSFEKACADVLHYKPDGLLIAPVLPEQATGFIKQLDNAVPYVFFDSTIPDAQPLTRIGQDAYQSGRLAARLMSMIVPRGSTIAVLREYPAVFHISERTRGFAEFFSHRAGYPLIFQDENRGINAASVRGIMERLHPSAGRIKGIFVANASVHYISEYIAAEKLDIRIIGYDAIPRNLPGVRNGSIDFLISQRPQVQTWRGISALYQRLALNQTCPEHIVAPIDVLTKENIDHYEI